LRPSGKTSRALVALLAACTAAVAAGCSAKEEDPDLSNGKALFVQKCASCHDLARANSQGNIIGPDLDAAFAASKRDGLGESAIEGVINDQIASPVGPQMPADLVTGQDATDVAAYVAFASAKPGQDTGALARAGQPDERKDPVAIEGGKLELSADPTGATLFVVPGEESEGAVKKLTSAPGPIELTMPNPSSVDHNIALRGDALDPVLGPVVNKGGTSQVKATVKAGEYTFFCSVGSHERTGMAGTLTVE
jgi:mono/diheme cytochrome c family protein/plastocyanin